MCSKIYELDPAKFLSAPGLAWQAALKTSKVMLNLSTSKKGYTLKIMKKIKES